LKFWASFRVSGFGGACFVICCFFYNRNGFLIWRAKVALLFIVLLLIAYWDGHTTGIWVVMGMDMYEMRFALVWVGTLFGDRSILSLVLNSRSALPNRPLQQTANPETVSEDGRTTAAPTKG
jgi:hypothetical protein